MFNDGSSNNHHHHFSVEKSFRIKQDDKFFSRLMSKETSMANTSSRVFYYGESSVAVPFVWEAQPGTPKHPLSETSLLPPLTPPPSYFTNSKSNHKRRSNSSKFGNSSSNMFSCILPRRKTHMSPSSSLSSSSSSSASSSASSSSSSWSLVYPSNSLCSIRDRDNNNHGSLSFSQLRNDDVGTFSKHKASSNGLIRGCYPFGSMKKKNAILSHEAV